jgi:hypothetical protein
MTSDLFYKTKKALENSADIQFLVFDESNGAVRVPINCGPECQEIVFRLYENLYSIAFGSLVLLNAAEGQNINVEEAVGDIHEVVEAIKTGRLKLVSYSLLGIKAYKVQGLASNRFAQTDHLLDGLIRKLGEAKITPLGFKNLAEGVEHDRQL